MNRTPRPFPSGTRVVIGKNQNRETGRIGRAMAESRPMPGPDWRIVRFDSDGRRLCVHVSRLTAIEVQP